MAALAAVLAVLLMFVLCGAVYRSYVGNARIDGPAAAFQRLVDPLIGRERWINAERNTIVRARGIDDEFRSALRARGLRPEGEARRQGGEK